MGGAYSHIKAFFDPTPFPHQRIIHSEGIFWGQQYVGRALKFIYQAHASTFVYLPLAGGPTKGGEESYYFSTAAGDRLGVCVSGGGVNVCKTNNN